MTTMTISPDASSEEKRAVLTEFPWWPEPMRVGEELAAGAYLEPRRRFWLFDARRREEVSASKFVTVASIAFVIPLAGLIAYFYALWMYPY